MRTIMAVQHEQHHECATSEARITYMSKVGVSVALQQVQHREALSI